MENFRMKAKSYKFGIALDYLKFRVAVDASSYGCTPEYPYTLLANENEMGIQLIEVGRKDAVMYSDLKSGCHIICKLSEMTNEQIEQVLNVK